ncbi:hypothetical protein BH09SUM1_BH09SUM1_12650 [soil metagenome]
MEMPVTEASEHFTEIVEVIERGEQVILTREGKGFAVVTLVPERARQFMEAIRKMHKLREELRAEGILFAPGELRAMRDEGRPGC